MQRIQFVETTLDMSIHEERASEANIEQGPNELPLPHDKYMETYVRQALCVIGQFRRFQQLRFDLAPLTSNNQNKGLPERMLNLNLVFSRQSP